MNTPTTEISDPVRKRNPWPLTLSGCYVILVIAKCLKFTVKYLVLRNRKAEKMVWFFLCFISYYNVGNMGYMGYLKCEYKYKHIVLKIQSYLKAMELS